MVSRSQFPIAPLESGGIAAALKPFGQSLMLPSAAYVDPAVFSWEQKHFFGGGWTCVGFASELPDAGDQRAVPVGAGSVLLTRDDDGMLHAFANFCRHRGHELLPCGGTVQRGSVVCPYHSWAYGLDGGLRSAQGFKGTAGFDGTRRGLVELAVPDWPGLLLR